MRKLLTCLLMVAVIPGWSQVSKDSILINERSIDRPLTLHKGQLRITGGYSLGIITKRFDDSGDVIRLSDEGLSSVRHTMLLELKYGVLDFIELQALLPYQSQTEREQSSFIFGSPDVYTNELREYNGMEDIFVGLNGRVPLKTKKIDIALLTGISLPTAKREPDKPTHEAFREDINGFEVLNVDYHYNYNQGNGVPVIQLGGWFKYRMPNMAFSAQVIHRHGLETGESYDWISQLDDDDNFEYQKDPYTFQLPDRLNGFVEVEYQPRPWLNLIATVSAFTATKGWIEEDGAKTAVPDATLISCSPGLEILITPKLWLRQRVQIPVAGENHESALTFFTTISYNFFPF